MRYLILSDMHANWDAFEVVLRRARRKRFDAVLVLGDLVGYGGAPNQVVEAVRELGPRLYTVRGNHDKVVTGIDSGSNFNQTALTAAQWTTTRLDPGQPALRPRAAPGADADRGERGDLPRLAARRGHLRVLRRRCLGDLRLVLHAGDLLRPHAHSLGLLAGGEGARGEGAARHLGHAASAPPGPLPGQPGLHRPAARPRPPGLVHDLRQRAPLVRWHRIDYPIAEAQRRIRKAGLPGSLADRLAVGA